MDGSRTHPPELVAPADWRTIDFISDLHLAEDTPATFEAWGRYMERTSADAVLILGDLFEAWVGDDARHDGFEASCARVLAHEAARRYVGFMAGNRDFLVGQGLLHEVGVHELADPTAIAAFGTRVLATHGDALCIGDTQYQSFRRMVRDPAWQAEQLRRPLEQRRALARQMRAQSEGMHAQRAPADWVDVDPPTAREWLRNAHANTLVHGHTHRPSHDLWEAGMQRYVLSDWDLEHATPARAEVLRWNARGLQRIGIDDAS